MGTRTHHLQRCIGIQHLVHYVPSYRSYRNLIFSIGIQYQSESGPGHKLPADDHSAKSVSRLLLTSPFCPVAIGVKFSRRQTIQRKHDVNGPQIAKIPPIQIWGINYPNTPVDLCPGARGRGRGDRTKDSTFLWSE